MTLTKIVSAAATVALAAALLATQAGTAFAAAEAGGTLSGYPTIDNTLTVTRQSWSDTLDGLDNSETNWYYCQDYNRIATPNGVMSAWRYGPMSWGTFSGSGWWDASDPGLYQEMVSSPNSDRWGSGGIQILYSNTFTRHSTNKIRFNCTSIYPGYETTGVTVQTPTEITATTATIHASVAIDDSARVCQSRAYVEYGSAPGSYDRQSSMLEVPLEKIRRALTLDPIRLTGLTPGTTYHYRVVWDEGDCWRHNNPPEYHRSYGSPNNTFTTAASPQPGQTYAIASFADGNAFIDVPFGRADVGLKLQLFEGNGSPAQQWTLVEGRARDGYFKIVRPEAPRLCLEIFGSGPLANAPIDQWTCAAPDNPNAPDQPNQLWQPVPQADGSFLLQSKAGGLLLSSAGGTANYTPLVARTPTAAPAATQKWSFIPLRAGALGAKRPKRRTKVVRCRGTARRCRARVGIAGGAVNRKIVIRLPGRNLHLRSVKVFPRRIATIDDERAAGSEQLYRFSDVRFKPRRRRFVVILNAAEWSPPGSHLIVKFKAPRQRYRQRGRP
jgi:hypothetical protein